MSSGKNKCIAKNDDIALCPITSISILTVSGVNVHIEQVKFSLRRSCKFVLCKSILC